MNLKYLGAKDLGCSISPSPHQISSAAITRNTCLPLLTLFANVLKSQCCEGSINPQDLHFDGSGLMPQGSVRQQSCSIRSALSPKYKHHQLLHVIRVVLALVIGSPA
jgi:hypothetical protein